MVPRFYTRVQGEKQGVFPGEYIRDGMWWLRIGNYTLQTNTRVLSIVKEPDDVAWRNFYIAYNRHERLIVDLKRVEYEMGHESPLERYVVVGYITMIHGLTGTTDEYTQLVSMRYDKLVDRRDPTVRHEQLHTMQGS